MKVDTIIITIYSETKQTNGLINMYVQKVHTYFTHRSSSDTWRKIGGSGDVVGGEGGKSVFW